LNWGDGFIAGAAVGLDVVVAGCGLLADPAARHSAAGFLVRLFMIQHDCGHGAFFRTRALNDWVGRVLAL